MSLSASCSFSRRGDEVARRVDLDAGPIGQHLAGERVDLGDALELVAPERDADHDLLGGRVDFERVAAHAELAGRQVVVVALVVDVGESAQHLVALVDLADAQVDACSGRSPRGRPDRRCSDAGDHQHVAPREQRLHRRVAQPLDVLVDQRVLLDIRIGARDVRLGLVVVVVRDEVLDRVVREELLELRGELRRERLVVGHDQRRPLDLLDHVGHGEGLAAAGDAEQGLVFAGRRRGRG